MRDMKKRVTWHGVLSSALLTAREDGLKGSPDVINVVYPEARIQRCIIHMVRNGLRFVSWKGYEAVTTGLKTVYQAPAEDAALMALDAFAKVWDDKYPQISKSWRAHWENLNTLFRYPQGHLHDKRNRIPEQRDPCRD